MTRLLLGFSDFMVTWWPAMLVALIGGIVAFRAWVGTHAGRMQWEALALRFPIAGKIVSKAAMARFARSFALSTRSGVPVMQALSNSAQTVDNSYIAAKIEGMRDTVERGESVLRASIAVGILHAGRAADGGGRRGVRCPRRHDGRGRPDVSARSRVRTENARPANRTDPDRLFGRWY